MTDTYAGFEDHVLDGHHVLIGRLPEDLRPYADGFQMLWALHVDTYHVIQMHGRPVKTPRWSHTSRTSPRTISRPACSSVPSSAEPTRPSPRARPIGSRSGRPPTGQADGREGAAAPADSAAPEAFLTCWNSRPGRPPSPMCAIEHSARRPAARDQKVRPPQGDHDHGRADDPPIRAEIIECKCTDDQCEAHHARAE
jgi:hypothetical protein